MNQTPIMSTTYETDGEKWSVYLGKDRQHPGLLPLIFHCTSNPSHGWRVVEVPDHELTSDDDVDRLSADRLAALFQRAKPFDHPRDPKAIENTVGDTPLR